MGLRWSMENILGWRSQFDRVVRWHRRISDCSDQEKLDFYLAFFQSCGALRDWFVESGVVAKEEMDALIDADRSMRLCRDVCNRSKHLRLRRTASADGEFSILREYRGIWAEDPAWALIIIAGDEKYDLWDIADGCLRFWELFVRERQIPEPSSAFSSRGGENESDTSLLRSLCEER